MTTLNKKDLLSIYQPYLGHKSSNYAVLKKIKRQLDEQINILNQINDAIKNKDKTPTPNRIAGKKI